MKQGDYLLVYGRHYLKIVHVDELFAIALKVAHTSTGIYLTDEAIVFANEEVESEYIKRVPAPEVNENYNWESIDSLIKITVE